MKHFKLLLSVVVFTLALTFTSCMENDPTVNDIAFGKVTSTFPYEISVGEVLKMVPTNQSALSSKELYNGDIVYFSFSYNSDEQTVTPTTKTLNVLIGELINLGRNEARVLDSNGEDEMFENATVLYLSSNSSSSSYAFNYFDKNTLILPISFLAKEDMEKHSFTLVCDKTEITSSDTELKFYLRHKSAEEKSTLLASTLKAFNIGRALEEFKGVTGKSPTKITIMTKESDKNGSDSLDDAKEELQSYSVEYKFEDK